jgi:hypothetical protein
VIGDNRFYFDGLTELRAALRALPRELANEGGEIVLDRAESAAEDVQFQYHEVTGRLAEGVKMQPVDGGRFGARAIVKNTDKKAWWYEEGTAARETRAGVSRGAARAHHVFVPTMIQHRREMYQQLKALLASKGLTVTGDA